MKRLKDWFARQPRVALAFSGGADSALLLHAAVTAGADVLAIMVKSQFQHSFERADATRLATELGVRLLSVQCDVLADPAVVANGPQRCYYCKRAMFATILAEAEKLGYSCVIDGTNASDDPADRPGMRALAELGIRSPLRKTGLDKIAIRALAKEAGLFTWNKPANACLATRIPTGMAITVADLARVEAAETGMRDLGFADLRVRILPDVPNLPDPPGQAPRPGCQIACVQLPQAELERAAGMSRQIIAAIRPYFARVLLDLEGR